MQILDVAKQKLESNGNYLSIAEDLLPDATIPLESRRYIGVFKVKCAHVNEQVCEANCKLKYTRHFSVYFKHPLQFNNE